MGPITLVQKGSKYMRQGQIDRSKETGQNRWVQIDRSKKTGQKKLVQEDKMVQIHQNWSNVVKKSTKKGSKWVRHNQVSWSSLQSRPLDLK